jgi:hypothetical protein
MAGSRDYVKVGSFTDPSAFPLIFQDPEETNLHQELEAQNSASSLHLDMIDLDRIDRVCRVGMKSWIDLLRKGRARRFNISSITSIRRIQDQER